MFDDVVLVVQVCLMFSFDNLESRAYRCNCLFVIIKSSLQLQQSGDGNYMVDHKGSQVLSEGED